MAAVIQDGRALRYASDELKKDPEVQAAAANPPSAQAATADALPPPPAINANAEKTKIMLEEAQKRVVELQEQLKRELAEKNESEGTTEGESKGE